MEGNVMQFEINYRKSIHAILYVINKLGGSVREYKLLQILFAADKYILNHALRTLTGDTYIKERSGAIPREICYDIIRGGNPSHCLKALGTDKLPFIVSATKTKRGDTKASTNKQSKEYKSNGPAGDGTGGDSRIISSDASYDYDELPGLAVRALDHALAEYGSLTYAAAGKKNRSEICWRRTPYNRQIPFEMMLDHTRWEWLEELLGKPLDRYILRYDINYHSAINAILYVINKMGGSVKEYNLLKILFAADKNVLNDCCKPVTGDVYVKESNGTVPRAIYYDILRGENLNPCLRAIRKDKLPFTVVTKNKDVIISSDVPYDDDYLAPIDEAELDQAIAEYGRLAFAAARAKNHREKCWQQTPDNQQIPFELMFDDKNRDLLKEALETPHCTTV